MSLIKVSILCLVYNHEPYLRKCLDGFVNQKCNFEYEVLIHDDASTDKSAEIIREYEQKYPNIIKPIYQTENQYSKGVKISATFQYPRAQGEYLAWCEGDDFWDDVNKLQMQVDFLDQHPEYVGCVHRYYTVDKQGNRTDVKTFGYYENSGVYTLEDFQKYELPSQLATLVCRNIYFKEGRSYPESFVDVNIQGDIKYFLYLLANGDLYRFEQTSSAYRFVQEVGEGSWSSRMMKNVHMPYSHWKALRKLEKLFCKEYGKKLKLKNRKLLAALHTVTAIRRNFCIKTICNAIRVLLAQRGLKRLIIKKVLSKKARKAPVVTQKL